MFERNSRRLLDEVAVSVGIESKSKMRLMNKFKRWICELGRSAGLRCRWERKWSNKPASTSNNARRRRAALFPICENFSHLRPFFYFLFFRLLYSSVLLLRNDGTIRAHCFSEYCDCWDHLLDRPRCCRVFMGIQSPAIMRPSINDVKCFFRLFGTPCFPHIRSSCPLLPSFKRGFQAVLDFRSAVLEVIIFRLASFWKFREFFCKILTFSSTELKDCIFQFL